MKNEATSLICSESVSALLLYLLEVVANRLRDDVKTEALAAGERNRVTQEGSRYWGHEQLRCSFRMAHCLL